MNKLAVANDFLRFLRRIRITVADLPVSNRSTIDKSLDSAAPHPGRKRALFRTIRLCPEHLAMSVCDTEPDLSKSVGH
jgi:hypothetical protein